MDGWAQLAKLWVDGGRTVYFAFNNTDGKGDESPEPAAVVDARHLAAALRRNGVFNRARTVTVSESGSPTAGKWALCIIRLPYPEQ